MVSGAVEVVGTGAVEVVGAGVVVDAVEVLASDVVDVVSGAVEVIGTGAVEVVGAGVGVGAVEVLASDVVDVVSGAVEVVGAGVVVDAVEVLASDVVDVVSGAVEVVGSGAVEVDVVSGGAVVVATLVVVSAVVVVTTIGSMWHVGTQYSVCETFSCGKVTVSPHCAVPFSTNVNPLLVVSFVVQNTQPVGKWDIFMHLDVSVFSPVVLYSTWLSCGHKSTQGSASPGLPCRLAASPHASWVCE